MDAMIGPPARDEDSEPEQRGSAAEPGAFPIVGVGASAGGIAAFEAFFSTMPPDTDPGMAFVLVQHLARHHKSILSELIRRYTQMRVFEVEDGMAVEANCAYIIPPNKDMTIVGGVLRLLEPSSARGIRLPIDFFFRSLADDMHERAICIVLSGTGHDGTLGVRAVKGAGGMVMAQTPETTEYDGMPRSAISTGMVDFVLAPEKMPAQLLNYAARIYGPSAGSTPPHVAIPTDVLGKVFSLLRSRTGHDFSQYKKNTITRRIKRRMAVHQADRMADYLRLLQASPSEVDALFRDFLIGVTSFFRDSDVFDVLKKTVVPQIFAERVTGRPIRIWVAGCSTGEEAYSLAMILREYMEERNESHVVSIFATDIDHEAIGKARAGVFPASISADVSPERLGRYFTHKSPEGSSYRVQKSIRDMVIFSEHNMLKDPPFSKLDLISCRNVLIYMSGELQKKLLPIFFYALRPGGFLLLGSSESVGDQGNLFATLDRTGKLFQRKENSLARTSPTDFYPYVPRRESDHPARELMNENKTPLREIVVRTLMDHYTPVGALVNERGEILYLLGRTGRFLEPAPGEASMNIFRMAREGLRGDLTIALHRAVSLRIPTAHRGVRLKDDEEARSLALTVLPVSPGSDGSIPHGLFLILIQDEAPGASLYQHPPALEPTDDEPEGPIQDMGEYVNRLKRELRAKDDYLQATIEELETSNEELRSAHEEMQSVNEEMQSANEELETSKEELQSVNEELATVNAELQMKVADLSRSNNDMKNLLGGTGIGTIFVDHRLHVLRFTPSVPTVVNLIETDLGRPLDQIRANLQGYDDLGPDVNEVLATLVPKELEVQTLRGQWYLLRIRPYRTLENVIEGAVITFTEITAMKNAQAALRDSEALRRLAVVVRDSRDAILVQDLAGQILAWNPGAVILYGWSESEALSMNVSQILPETDHTHRGSFLLQADAFTPQQVRRLTKQGETVPVSLLASPLFNEAGEMYAIATTERGVPSEDAS